MIRAPRHGLLQLRRMQKRKVFRIKGKNLVFCNWRTVEMTSTLKIIIYRHYSTARYNRWVWVLWVLSRKCRWNRPGVSRYQPKQNCFSWKFWFKFIKVIKPYLTMTHHRIFGMENSLKQIRTISVCTKHFLKWSSP